MACLDQGLDRLLSAPIADGRACGLDGGATIRRAAYAILSVRRDPTPDEAWVLAELALTDSFARPT